MSKKDDCCPCDPPDVARIGAAMLTGGFSELIANTFSSSNKK
jgi:hypothetical protein